MSDTVTSTPRLSGGIRNIQQSSSQPGDGAYSGKDVIRENYGKERDMSKVTVIPAAPVPSLFDSHKKQRVAVYCRVSTDGISQTTSFELQKNYYLKYVKKKPEWTLAAMYSDEGITATNTKHRGGLLKMIEDAKAGKFDIIVVKNLSRLSRNLMDCMNIIKELRNLPNPVGILFETENMYTLGENMDFTLQILSLVAQEESHKKSEAMNASYKQRFEQGMFMKPDLLGYDRVGVNEIAVNPEEAKTVQLIFMMYLAAVPLTTIAEVLMMLGRKTHVHKYKDGRTKGGEVKWTASSVRNVLTNERRCGDVLAQKTYTEDYLTHKSVKNINKLPQYYAKDQHEAIVSPADYWIAQRMLNADHPKWLWGLPQMQIHESGPLSGFVTTVPDWAGFTAEDYNRACLRAHGVEEERLDEIADRISDQEQKALTRMQAELKKQANWDDDFVLFADEQEVTVPVETEPVESFHSQMTKLCKTSSPKIDKKRISTYDLSNCELIRPQFFSLTQKMYFTLDKKSITFNKNCFRKFGEGSSMFQVMIKYNPAEKLMLVVPSNAQEDTDITLRWAKETKYGSIEMRKCGCRGIARSIYENMGWNEDFKYRVVGNKVTLDGVEMIAFYLDEPIIVVPVKENKEADEESSIVSKEVLPEDTTDLPPEDKENDGAVDKAQSRSRAIYFDDFAARQDESFSVSDLGEDKYSPECIKRLLQKGTAPVEGWIYLNGMAKMTKHGFTIFPASWSDSFGTNIYERASAKVERRSLNSAESQGETTPYGWTVGLDLPTMETVQASIETLKAEMAM